MGIYKLEVIRRGIIIVDDVDSMDVAKEYIENCNPVEEVSWSDFLEVQEGGTELHKISVPDFMPIREFAEKIKVRPAEIIKWLFLCGKVKQLNSEIGFDDMREFADGYGFICEREVWKRDIGDLIKNMVLHIDPIEFYGNMIDFPVMGMEEIPGCFRTRVWQAINQLVSRFIETNNITDTSSLTLELDIRVQVNVTNDETECEFVVIVLDSEYKYGHVSKRIMIKDNDCLFEFKKYYTKKLEVLFFEDVKTIEGFRI